MSEAVEAGQELKRCAVCDAFFFRRSPSGALITWKTWHKKTACGPRCAATYRWRLTQEAKST